MVKARPGKSWRKRPKASRVQMAPMIDMVFLLLVFFMCVSSLSQAGLRVEVELPESETSEVPRDLSERIILSIKSDGTVYLSGEIIAEDDLVNRLVEVQKFYSGKAKLRIRADHDTEYSRIQSVMKAAAEAGISDYIYGTYQAK